MNAKDRTTDGNVSTGSDFSIMRIAKISGVVVVALWGGNLVVGTIGLCTDGKAAALGDSFGIVSSLFSGLAFAGVIAALWMQREELSLQRDELKATRAEFEKQTKIQDEHLELLRREREHREADERLKASPALMIRHQSTGIGPNGSVSLVLKIYNAGAPVFDLDADGATINGVQIPRDRFYMDNDIVMERGEPNRVHALFPEGIPGNLSVQFRLHYKTLRQERLHSILGMVVST